MPEDVKVWVGAVRPFSRVENLPNPFLTLHRYYTGIVTLVTSTIGYLLTGLQYFMFFTVCFKTLHPIGLL